VKTDSLFYRLFSIAPSLFFELIGQEAISEYRFQSVEVKQTAFRIDGVFLPPPDRPDLPIFFTEVQFQKDETLYQRLFAEIFLYLAEHGNFADWQAVVIFPRRSLEPGQTHLYQTLLNSPQVQRVYLNELESESTASAGLDLIQLIVTSPKAAPDLAKQLCIEADTISVLPAPVIIELIITIMVYKFPNLSREEVVQMLEIAESLRETRFYQDVLEEGRQEGRQVGLQEGQQKGEVSIALRLLKKRFGPIAPETVQQIEALSLHEVEDLADALLDFRSLNDLHNWLQSH
jgi:predicted transposase/invertase (TIGR01784 family)